MDLDTLLQDWREWFERLFPLLILLGLYIFRQVRTFAKAKHLKEIAPLINGALVIRPFSAPRIQGNYMGMPYRISFYGAGRATPGRMQIQIDYTGLFTANLTPRAQQKGLEEIFSRGKGLATGDESFDNAVLVRAEREPEKAGLYLDNPINRKGVLTLFESGFVSIRFFEKGVLLTKLGDFLGKGSSGGDRVVGDLELAYKLLS